jgi:hypothetical protein
VCRYAEEGRMLLVLKATTVVPLLIRHVAATVGLYTS